MKRRLRRFAAVGIIVTALDVATLVWLRVRLGLPVIVADGLAISVAAAASYLLNRAVTFGGDPHVRWVHDPVVFVRLAFVAGLVDVAVLRVGVALVGSTGAGDLLVAKAAAVGSAAGVRVVGYRRRLFRKVRDEQARRAGRPPAPGERRLSVVVPAYREADRIGDTVARIRAELAPALVPGDLEVVVVDDGSGDGTAAAARRAGADQVVRLAENRGKGAAVRAGVQSARGRTIVFTDADLAYPPEQLADVLAGVEAGWDVVVGSRRHVDTTTLVRAHRLREVSGRVFNLLTYLVLLGHYRDTQCGLKGFRSDVGRLLFAHTRLDGFAFDVEVFHLAERCRLSLTEVPVALAATSGSTVRVGADALRMVRDLFRIRRWAGRGAYDLALEDGMGERAPALPVTGTPSRPG